MAHSSVLYTADLGSISARFGVWSHFYANDSQLYISATPFQAVNAGAQLVGCMEAMAQWMASNRLKLNQVKTDFEVRDTPAPASAVHRSTVV